jgi:hypothetical protein
LGSKLVRKLSQEEISQGPRQPQDNPLEYKKQCPGQGEREAQESY